MENYKETKKTGTGKKAEAQNMELFKLINKVLEITCDANEIVPRKSKVYLEELMKRMSLDNLEQASLFCTFVNMFDDKYICIRDLANHYRLRPVSILCELDDIDALVSRRLIKRYMDHGETSYRLPQEVLDGLRKNAMIECKKLINLDIFGFVSELESLLENISEGAMSAKDATLELNELIDGNQNLYLARKLKAYNLNIKDAVLYIRMALLFINNNDDGIRRHDFEGLFSNVDLRRMVSDLEEGSHLLMKEKLIEHSCIDGQVEPTVWKLTDFSKEDILQELKLVRTQDSRTNLLLHEDIKEKKLFYNERVTKEVSKLHGLLDEERMKRVLRRMESCGMRKGFTCLFYGGPGTGKTETVMQIARETGRDIMMVDVPNIRSKWVGDTEKNIKRVFDQYRRLARNNGKAPILLFNEADALFNKRNEGGSNAVDKMENAMQNIILQELESLEGILIATTNLTGNLDAAFERRFLYKIEFDKPTASERCHIWKSMLPDLSDEQAYLLADRFDFSGGQIENIARKRIVNDILSDCDGVDMESIIDTCKVENLNKKVSVRVGF